MNILTGASLLALAKSIYYFIMIIRTLLVSSGSCNCPFSWIYIQLVSRSSRKQTPHCISKEGECNKMNKCTKKKEKLENMNYQWGQKHGKMIISVSSVCCYCCFCVFMFYINGQLNVTLIMKVNVIKLEQS